MKKSNRKPFNITFNRTLIFKGLIFPCLLFLIFVAATAPGEPVLMKLPVRVMTTGTNGHDPVRDLAKTDCRLTINNAPTPITDFIPKNRSMVSPMNSAESGAPAGEGRQLVLSFDITAYDTALADATAHLVNRVLAPKDRLILRSPLHVYEINAAAPKTEIIDFIRSKLDTDIQKWKKEKSTAIDTMQKLIDDVEKQLKEKKGGFRQVSFFTNHYTYQWKKFVETFLYSDLRQYGNLASMLSRRPGERWMIHFREPGEMPMIKRFQAVRQKILDYLPSLSSSYREAATMIAQSLENITAPGATGEDFPLRETLDAMLGVNLGYHVVWLDPGAGSPSPTPGGVLENLCRQTGGLFVRTAASAGETPTKAIKRIVNHKDFYYEVIFPLGGRAEDKTIGVEIGRAGAKAFHKSMFKEGEVKFLEDWLEKEITLSGYKLEGHRLTFEISGFKRGSGNGENPAGKGLITVEIHLYNDQSEAVFETRKDLAPDRESITVSLGLPGTLSGYFKLVITAQDQASGRSAEIKKYVKM